MIEDVCVPGADSSVALSNTASEFFDLLVYAINEMRNYTNREYHDIDINGCLLRLQHLQLCNAELMKITSIIPDLVDSNSMPHGALASAAGVAPQDALNDFGEMADLLAKGLGRALVETYESVRTDNPLYILHHRGIACDLAQELTRLANESCGICTEKLLENSHPRRVLLEKNSQTVATNPCPTRI